MTDHKEKFRRKKNHRLECAVEGKGKVVPVAGQ
jgi:hypothetical protein